MPVTATAAGVLLGSLILGVSVLASDAPGTSPDASSDSDAVADRLARLEEEVAMLSARAPTDAPAPHSSCCCCPPQGWFAAVDWINWQVRQRERFLILGDSGNPFFRSRPFCARGEAGVRQVYYLLFAALEAFARLRVSCVDRRERRAPVSPKV